MMEASVNRLTRFKQFLTVLILGVLVPVFLFSGEAKASDVAVKCVQNQLNDLGYDVGPIDGVLGKKSASAFNAYIKSNSIDTDLAFIYPNAQTACRILGRDNPSLQRYWPANINRFSFSFSNTVQSSVAHFVENLLLSSDRKISANFEIIRSGQDKILVGTNVNELKSLIKSNVKVKIKNLDKTLNDMCSSKRNISAYAFPSMMYICVNKSATLGQEIGMDWLRFLLVHELYHLYEFEVGGVAVLGSSQEEVLLKEGPVWLQEGIAQAFANRTVMSTTDAEYREIMGRKLEQKIPNLESLEQRNALDEKHLAVYRAGAYAATLLLEDYGAEKVGIYLENLSKSSSWEDAFAEAFGVSVDAFYQSVHKQN